jgi:hypothetical protein
MVDKEFYKTSGGFPGEAREAVPPLKVQETTRLMLFKLLNMFCL